MLFVINLSFLLSSLRFSRICEKRRRISSQEVSLKNLKIDEYLERPIHHKKRFYIKYCSIISDDASNIKTKISTETNDLMKNCMNEEKDYHDPEKSKRANTNYYGSTIDTNINDGNGNDKTKIPSETIRNIALCGSKEQVLAEDLKFVDFNILIKADKYVSNFFKNGLDQINICYYNNLRIFIQFYNKFSLQIQKKIEGKLFTESFSINKQLESESKNISEFEIDNLPKIIIPNEKSRYYAIEIKKLHNIKSYLEKKNSYFIKINDLLFYFQKNAEFQKFNLENTQIFLNESFNNVNKLVDEVKDVYSFPMKSKHRCIATKTRKKFANATRLRYNNLKKLFCQENRFDYNNGEFLKQLEIFLISLYNTTEFSFTLHFHNVKNYIETRINTEKIIFTYILYDKISIFNDLKFSFTTFSGEKIENESESIRNENH